MRIFLKHAFSKMCIVRAVKVSLFVGTLLALINHFDAILKSEFTSTNLFQIIVTYLVPYSVSTFSSAMQARHMDMNNAGLKK